jgi:diguanylate cyclase (GGDEF)-like protein
VNAGPTRNRRPGSEDRSVRRTWWLLSGTFLVLIVITGAHALTAGDPGAWIAVVAVALAGLAAMAHRNAVVSLEARGRAEAETFARILSGLSRSSSVDAVVGAIVEDLLDGTGADHVVVARLRPEGGALDATLVTRRPGVPNSTTVLPLGDIEIERQPARGTEPVGIPIRPEPDPLILAAAAARADRVPVGLATRSTTSMLDAAATITPPARSGPSSGSRLGSTSGLGTPARIVRVVADGGTGLLGADAGTQVADRIAGRIRAAYGLRQTLAAPLVTDDGVIGAIVLSRRDRDGWDAAARRLLDGAAIEASAALARAYTFREITARATTDPLTGLPNRRYFDEVCSLLARRRRAGDAIAVLMIDIDRFKALNDTHGHPVGDEVLRAVSGAIVSAVREDDVPARIGGEEFAVLLRNPGPDVAVEVGERVRAMVRALDLSRVGVDGVSVSVGVADARRGDEAVPDLLHRADQALLLAKRSGRDRVISG